MSVLGEKAGEELSRTGSMILRVVLRQAALHTSRDLKKLLHSASQTAVNHIKNATAKPIKHGEVNYETLREGVDSLAKVDITSADIEKYREALNRYNVDFSVMKRNDGAYEVWYKGKDLNQVESALKDTMEMVSKDLDKPTLDEKISKSQEAVKKQEVRKKERNITKTKHKTVEIG